MKHRIYKQFVILFIIILFASIEENETSFSANNPAPEEDFEWKMFSTEGVAITKYNGSAVDLIIPDKLSGEM